MSDQTLKPNINQARLTLTAKKAIQDCIILCQLAGHAKINHFHVFSSFWRNSKSNFQDFAEAMGFSISTEFLSLLMEKYFLTLPEEHLLTSATDYQSCFDVVLPAAFLLADRLGHEFVGVEHVIYGVLKSSDSFCDFLLKQDVDTEHLKKCIKSFIEGKSISANSSNFGDGDEEDEDDEMMGGSTPEQDGAALETYCINLNELVKSDNFSPIFPRHQEISQMEQILCRKSKSNCILIGEAGTGKTSIVEGLAQLIQEESYNGPLKDHFIYTLDLAKMLAGTLLRGQFEKRFKKLLTDLEGYDNLILFIDEAHAIIGAGSREGSFDLANMLKPALARGTIKCIAATTQNEYTRHIEKDPALSRRFQPVFIKEPDQKDMVAMIKFSLSSYEQYHGITVPHNVLCDLVRLCDIYLVGKKFPDKGFDILDQSMAYARLNSDKKKLSTSDIVEVISQKAEVSKSSIWDTLKFKFAEFEAEVTKEVFGQKEAIAKVYDSLVCSKAGLKHRKKPLASLFFVGPTGVGKTHLAKKIAKEYFGNEDNLLQINLTEYTDQGSVSKLIGTGAGYVGFEDGGLLTRFTRKRPNSVILFDEADKCHSSVLNMLLQIMDEGSLADGSGQNVDFSQTIIILTSNGFSGAKDAIGFLGGGENKYITSITSNLPPEFVSRVDEVIAFNELNFESLEQIFRGTIDKIAKDLKVNIDIHDDVPQTALKNILNARDVEQAVRKLVSVPISKHIIANGKIKKISLKVVDNSLNLEYN